jgi:hypothetical protein
MGLSETVFFIMARPLLIGRKCIPSFQDRNRYSQNSRYFTNLTYWSIGFYMAFSGLHTVIYARRGVAPLQNWPRILQLLHSLFYTTIVIYPFLVYINPPLASDKTQYSLHKIEP